MMLHMSESSKTRNEAAKRPTRGAKTPAIDEGLQSKRNEVSAEVGASLKQFRLAKHMSQEALAFNSQLDRTFISNVERGIANPSVMALGVLCYALGITLADLFAPVRVSLHPSDPTRRINAAKVDDPNSKPLSKRRVPRIKQP
jgi:transcriptional regulator with XRE-family HTH domain